MSVHPAASEGFERAAAAYERGRPSYPPAAVDWLVAGLGIRLGTTVIDLGAGTGKLTRMLQPTGAQLIAVEPVSAMREELARAVPGVEVLDGTAQAMPCADASADAIIRRYRGRAPAHESDHWRDAIATSPLFRPAGERQFRHRQVVDADRLVDRVLSISFMATLSDDNRAAVAENVRQLAQGRAQIVLPYRTDAFLFRRT